MFQEKAERVLARVTGVLDFKDFKEADMVVEAVIEDVALKQQIFEELERVCRPDCVLSTNTSTIDLDVCAAKMRQPERIVGAHGLTAHAVYCLKCLYWTGS